MSDTVCRWLSLTQDVVGRVIPGVLVPVSEMKMRSLLGLSSHSAFRWWYAHCAARTLLSDKQMSCCAGYKLVSWFEASCICIRWTAGVRAPWPGARDSVASLRRSSQGWMPARMVVRWCRTQASSHTSIGVVDRGVSKASVSTATPERSAVFCGWMHQG